MSDPRSFYAERIPEQFNRAFEKLQAKAEQPAASEDDARILAGVAAVETSLRVVVDGDSDGSFFLNVDAGRMSCADGPTHPLFLTLVQDLNAFRVLERESGDSALGFLGGLAGLAGEFHLTAERLSQLGEVGGCLRFELQGDDGFSLLSNFGAGEAPSEPDATISVSEKAYAELQSGELNPMEAFMGGQIEILGDMQMAMQLALAMLNPD
jgi:hypothetical protein